MYGVGMGSGMTGGPAAPAPGYIPTLPAPAIPGPWNDNKGPGLIFFLYENVYAIYIYIAMTNRIKSP